MSDNKKYYYLKLKDNFFDSDQMIVMESMPDGYKYSNILLKLYLRSLKNEGKLMFNDRIPYNSTMLSQVTRHSVGDVEKALHLFKELDLVEVMDNGAIFVTDIQNFIGESSTEADRKRAYRKRIDEEKQQQKIVLGQMSDKSPDKTPPELEIEKELDIEKEKSKKTNRNSGKPKYDDTSLYLILAYEFYELILSNNSGAKEPNFQKWADDFRKMIEIDKRDEQHLREVMQWSQRDSFWKGNILSANKLRQKFDQLAVQSGKAKPFIKQENQLDWL